MTGVLVLLLVTAAGCSTDVSGPSTQFGGVKYTAVTNDIVTCPLGVTSGPQCHHQFSVIVTMQNTTGATLTRTYPAGCPVRVQLYRLSDNARLYDETRWACDATPVATITLPGFSTTTLSSGVRFPGNVAGDSLPLVAYTVRAVVFTEGAASVIINAGTYTLTSGSQG
jgi:hypothetical protein